MKKRVIAYLHTHWDLEWYREFEVFRLRLLRVFDNVLELLQSNKIPSFYFDGQVCALLDYLELRPEKELIVRKFIKEKRLFIGPFYTLVDEFLTDKRTFYKNIEIGLKIAREFGCEDFIGYFADTFGHSKNVPKALKYFGIDKCAVWRGVGDLPSEFKFCGINCVNLVRGYFNDIFATNLSLEKKAEFIKKELDLIAKKSGDVLLMPIGADHLGVPVDINEQILKINKLLNDYDIVLSNPFEYFELVKNNFKVSYDDELRGNSRTFILPGCYSARRDLKQLSMESAHKLSLAEDFVKKCNQDYSAQIDYAYKLLLRNRAHDGICGCSTDDVHFENTLRYKKILQIADTIIDELKFKGFEFKLNKNIEIFISDKIQPDSQVILKRKTVEGSLFADTLKIPVTEDFKTYYTQIREIEPCSDVLQVCEKGISNKFVSLKIKNGKIYINDKVAVEFVRQNDLGDTYNFAPDIAEKPQKAKFISSKILSKGPLLAQFEIKTDFFKVVVSLEKCAKLLGFKIKWNNRLKNKLWQVCFCLPKPVTETCSEDMDEIIHRKFDPNYDMRMHLPKSRGIEAMTNFAPMERLVWTQGFGIVTRGLNEYEVNKNSLNVTILRSVGIISNPKNTARSTPAGPPIEVKNAQLLGENVVEFFVGEFPIDQAQEYINFVYPKVN